jgi:hypothetical protein
LGWVFSAETVTARIDRDLRRLTEHKNQMPLSVHPAVAAYLMQDDATVKKMLEKEHKIHLALIEDEQLDQDEYMFSDSRIIPEKGDESLAHK